MRKWTAVAVAFVLIAALFSPTFASAATDYSYVKVRLSSIGSPSSVQFKVDGAYRVAEDSAVDLFPGITYTAKAEGSGITLSYNNGVGTVTRTLPAKFTLTQYTNGVSRNYLYLNNAALGWRYYAGSMTFIRPSGTTTLQLVNTVFIETYLYGVIAYEMGNDWPIEALKAQAVCARTYAMKSIKTDPSATWHLVDTSASQVYRGYPFLSDGVTPMANVISAVDATRGKALLSGDPAALNLASGEYSASNGGQIRNTAVNDDYDVRNTSSPSFTFIFPKSTSAATLNLLGTNDKAKANTMLTLLKDKAPQALQDQYGISCSASDIQINSISAVAPTALRTGMPAGSREFTKVSVTLNVTVVGAPSPTPTALVKGNNLDIADGDTTPAAEDYTDFGSSTVGGAAVTRTFKLYNNGTGDLNVSAITATGGDSADFTVTTPTPFAVSPGAFTDVTVSFVPGAVGLRTTTISIASNDANTPYTFVVQGTGAAAAGLLADSTAPEQSAAPDQSAEPAPTDGQGGGGMPAGFTGNITVTLDYVSQASDGGWDNYGEMRTRFTSYYSMLGTSSLWLLYDSASSDGKFLYITARGYGHGRGLSQRGAQQMAKESKTSADILGFYFSGYTASSVSITQKALSQIPGNGSSAQWGKVTASTLNIRAAAGTGGILVGTLPKNTVVEILSTSGSWYRILRGSTGQVGYVSSQYVTKTTAGPTATPTPTPTPQPTASPTPAASPTATASPTPAPTASPGMGRVIATSLNLRAQTNTTSTILYTLKKGDSVVILDTRAATNWYKVRYLGYTGYCMYQSGATLYIETIGTAPSSTATPTPSATATAPAGGPLTVPTLTAKCNVSSGTLTLRETASTSGNALASIPKGATFTVQSVYTNAAWLKVSYSSKVGYVLAKYALVGNNTAYRACTVTSTSALNVRSGPATTYAILGTLRPGATVIYTATSGSWYKIQVGSVTGYIDSRYARKSTP